MIVIHVMHCPSFTLPVSHFPSFLFLPSSAVSAQLTVTPLPNVLFQNNSGVHNIVNQSVIWLYCTADSANATITWTKDGETLVNDPAHIRIRSSSSGMSTTSSLVVDNFQTPDNGDYVCQARDGTMTASSSTLSFTGECGCESTLRIQGNRVIGHGCESTTNGTGNSKVKEQGSLSLPYRGLGACSPENFWNFWPYEL